MLHLSLADIARETGARYSGADRVVAAVSTDTRDLPRGCLFIALKGELFNGHEFIGKALESGADFAVAMEDGDWPQERVLRVRDTRDALMAVARLHRKMQPAKIAAVTGSVGKTTTKEMIACVMQSRYKTLKTEANLNNEIGLSKTILRLDDSYEAAILEMGSDGPGQIAKLTRTAMPDIAVVTSVGVSHIEAFLTREGILAEKISIADGVPDGGDLILNGDNDLLRTISIPRLNVVFFGIENAACHVRAENVHEFATHTDFDIVCSAGRFPATLPTLGRHNVYNALAAFCVGRSTGIPPEKTVAALADYRPAGMRQNIVEHNSYTVVEDCYNASPDSMRAALGTLGHLDVRGRRIAVLADMLELGPIAEESHFETGRFAASCGIDYLLCTGELSRNTVAAARSAGLAEAYHYPDQNALFSALVELLKSGDAVWFKASHGMRLEKVIERLYDYD